MVYVFTFLGEFGYELLNWQGVIRKFAKTRGPSDLIVCCSRANLYPIYDCADLYIDISDLPLFRQSRACAYSGTIGLGAPGRAVNRAFDAMVRATVRRSVRRRLQLLGAPWSVGQERLVFIFSSRRHQLHGLTFGCDPGRIELDADIGDRLDLTANLFEQLRPDFAVQPAIEAQLGFSLREPYILVQTRARRVGPRSERVPKVEMIRALSEHMRVVLLAFETGRSLDSFSRFPSAESCIRYTGRTFPEQACLIHFARHCVFFTEGDFGSHTYVPPLMGRDVVAFAPASVYEPWRTSIDFWNRHVFRFGGQLHPKVAEETLASAAMVQLAADDILTAGREADVVERIG